MPYSNTSLRMLYNSALSGYTPLSGPILKMQALIEAENIEKVWDLVTEWFHAMESGETEMRRPDPFFEPPEGLEDLTEEIADSIVEEIDLDFALEAGRMKSRGQLPPEFKRLGPEARMAFAQEIYHLLKSQADIEAEAKELMNQGFTAESYLTKLEDKDGSG